MTNIIFPFNMQISRQNQQRKQRQRLRLAHTPFVGRGARVGTRTLSENGATADNQNRHQPQPFPFLSSCKVWKETTQHNRRNALPPRLPPWLAADQNVPRKSLHRWRLNFAYTTLITPYVQLQSFSANSQRKGIETRDLLLLWSATALAAASYLAIWAEY